MDWRGVLADIGRARTRLGRTRLGRFSIEGTRLHERALRAGAGVEATLVAASFVRSPSPRVQRLLGDLQDAGCAIHAAPDDVVGGVTEGRDIGAIVGLVPFPRAPELAAVLKGVSRRAVILAAVDVEDPGNVGALTRTALAGGADAFACVGISDAYHPRAARTSMGSLFRLPVLHFDNVQPLFGELHQHGVEVLGAVSRGGEPIHEIRLDAGAVALLMGCEAAGLEQEIRFAVDRLVSIPMPLEVDSFAVNAAAAIMLYELRRRA